MFTSACLSKNAPHVLTLEISGTVPLFSFLPPLPFPCLPRKLTQRRSTLSALGFISPRPPPLNTFPAVLSHAVQLFTHLSRVTLTPITFHEDLVTETLITLKSLSCLQTLTVGSCCTDDARAPLLVEITGLRHLAIVSPTRAVLQLLPEWLSRLSNTLAELHLKVSFGGRRRFLIFLLCLPVYLSTCLLRSSVLLLFVHCINVGR